MVQIFDQNDYFDRTVYCYDYLDIDSAYRLSEFEEECFFDIVYPRGVEKMTLVNTYQTIGQKYIDSIITASKLTLIDFWYLSCAPCLKASPFVEKMWRQLKDSNIQVIGIDPFDSQEEIDSFLIKKNYSYRSYANKTASKKYTIGSYPTVLLINRKGDILFRVEGLSSETYHVILEYIKKQN